MKFKWLPHALSALWLLCSVFVLGFLALADILAEQNGPLAQEIILLPVTAQIAVGLSCYLIGLLWKVSKQIARSVRT
jgi:hypothetical protein